MSERTTQDLEEADAYIDYNFKKPSRLQSAKNVGLQRQLTQPDLHKQVKKSRDSQLNRLRQLFQQSSSTSKLVEAQPQIINLNVLERQLDMFTRIEVK